MRVFGARESDESVVFLSSWFALPSHMGPLGRPCPPMTPSTASALRIDSSLGPESKLCSKKLGESIGHESDRYGRCLRISHGDESNRYVVSPIKRSTQATVWITCMGWGLDILPEGEVVINGRKC